MQSDNVAVRKLLLFRYNAHYQMNARAKIKLTVDKTNGKQELISITVMFRRSERLSLAAILIMNNPDIIYNFIFALCN